MNKEQDPVPEPPVEISINDHCQLPKDIQILIHSLKTPFLLQMLLGSKFFASLFEAVCLIFFLTYQQFCVTDFL